MQTTVLVAGAGPTGLTLAIDLARRGVPVRIVEKATEHFNGSRGDGLQPRTLEVFDDLGVLDAVFAAGSPQMPMRAYRGFDVVWEGRMSPITEPTPAVPYPNAWVLGQSHTEAILRERLAGLGVTVELATELVGFTQDEQGVTATLSGPGGLETVRAAYLVGADGARSVVRKTLGIAFPGITDESIRMVLGDMAADGLDLEHIHWFSDADDPKAGIVLSPLPGTRQFQFGMPLGDAAVEPTLETLQAVFDRASGRTDIRLHDLTWSTVWRPNVRLAEQFRVGRVFLAGDAAHVHPPTGGQGLNTGVQDAYNLGWKLADGAPELLDSYEAERRMVAEQVLDLSTRLMRKHTDGDADAHERGPETQQLGLSYRTGPAPSRGVVAGDRAPDAPLRDPAGHAVRLFDLYRGPHATMLVFGSERAVEDREGVRAYSVVRHADGRSLVDQDGHAYDAYDATDGTVVLVRPDGHVAQLDRAGATAAPQR
jgi:2-polyprenyl-6-methoxyphenol hydroxylase-like FAD-dependent oxidoreductase